MFGVRFRTFCIAFLVFSAARFDLCAQIAAPKDAQQEITFAKEAEADPLGPGAPAQREAALKIVQDDHTTHVLLCMQLFGEMNRLKGNNAGAIRQQYLISAAAYLYEHPEAATNSNAQNVAGLQSALHVYAKFQAADPKLHSKFLDSMQKQEDNGMLSQAITKLCH